MYRQKDRKSGQAQGTPRRTPLQPILAAKRRRQLYPFFFRMGPVALSMCSVLLISLAAILYLSQVGQAVTANSQIQSLRQQQATLQKQDKDLVNTIAQEQAPAYIASRAAAQGLVPVDPKNVHIIVVPHIKATPGNQNIQP
jgi:cell division protein FtsL